MADPSPVPPRTPHEEAIAAIWREILDRVDIGVEDDFFDLNGSSLQAIEMVARIRETWGVDIRARDFFARPTVAALAAAVAAAASSEGSVVTRRPPDAEPVLSFDQQRLWLEHQLRPGAAYHVHERRHLVGVLDVDALQASIRAIVARHEALRTRFPTVDGQPIQVVDDPDERWRITVRDLSGDGEDRAEAAQRLADEHAAAPFDLARGPLFRCLLIRLDDTEHVLSVTAHHIICDSWSIGLFIQEFVALYRAGGDPDRAGLPELPVQYRDYAVWQRKWLAGQAVQAQVEHWRQHLDGAPPALALPAVGRPSPFDGVGQRILAGLSEEETNALRQLCVAYGVTPFMALLAALATVLSRWSGQPDVVIGVPITGRTHVGTEKLIGFFVNTLPLRISLAGEPTFAELVGQVRQAALASYANADVPLDLLVQELQVARDPGRTPLFQVLLNVIDTPQVEQISGLSVSAMDAPAQPSKVDLTLTARESRGALRLEYEFNARRYQPAMMRHLVEQVGGLLRAALRDATRPVLDYPPRPGAAGQSAADLAASGVRGPGERVGIGAGDRVAVLSGLAGDVTPALAAVGVAIAAQDLVVADDVGALVKSVQSGDATVLYATPPVLRAVLADAQPAQLRSLRYVFVDNRGGLLSSDVEALRGVAPACRCVGVYRAGDGRPLATYLVPQDWQPQTAPLRVPLGTVLDTAPVRLVHPSGDLAAVGEVAEIRVGDQPTGHLGRRWADGTLEYAGTVDGGIDIDTVETLVALREVPGARDAVLTEHTGYIAGPDPQSAAEIRQHLLTRLAHRLVPRHLVVLDRLPLTPDGEYDLSRLPLPAPDGDADDSYVAPRTPLERQLADILRQLLGVDRVGVHDSFFELGGFSLLATRLTSRIREEFNVELSLRDIFQSPTVDRLAQLILRAQGAEELEALLDEIAAGEPDQQ